MKTFNLIYGKHVVKNFIIKHPNLIKKIWISGELKIDFSFIKVKVIKVDIPKLNDILGEIVNHQNIVAKVKEYNYISFEKVLKQITISSSNKNISQLFLILDQIQDPYNFGAIIRSASLLGVDQIVILDHRQVFITPTVVKTSAGTVYDVQICKVSNLNNVIKKLQKKGFWVYSTYLNSNAIDMRKVDFTLKTAIIIGNEHKGVSKLVMKNSDMNIFIPSLNTIDSYNANVAASLVLFQIANHIGKLK